MFSNNSLMQSQKERAALHCYDYNGEQLNDPIVRELWLTDTAWLWQPYGVDACSIDVLKRVPFFVLQVSSDFVFLLSLNFK